jgi:hypothetical protein
VPTDGTTSLNSDLTTGLNSPKNYAGATGSVDASPPIPTPALPGCGLILAAVFLTAAGLYFTRRRYQTI